MIFTTNINALNYFQNYWSNDFLFHFFILFKSFYVFSYFWMCSRKLNKTITCKKKNKAISIVLNLTATDISDSNDKSVTPPLGNDKKA